MCRSLGFPAVPLSGSMSDHDRTHCLRKFKSGDRPVLIASVIKKEFLNFNLFSISRILHHVD